MVTEIKRLSDADCIKMASCRLPLMRTPTVRRCLTTSGDKGAGRSSSATTGLRQSGAGPELYFAGFRSWHRAERRAMRFVRGSVLDIGCGAGRDAGAL